MLLNAMNDFQTFKFQMNSMIYETLGNAFYLWYINLCGEIQSTILTSILIPTVWSLGALIPYKSSCFSLSRRIKYAMQFIVPTLHPNAILLAKKSSLEKNQVCYLSKREVGLRAQNCQLCSSLSFLLSSCFLFFLLRVFCVFQAIWWKETIFRNGLR